MRAGACRACREQLKSGPRPARPRADSIAVVYPPCTRGVGGSNPPQSTTTHPPGTCRARPASCCAHACLDHVGALARAPCTQGGGAPAADWSLAAPGIGLIGDRRRKGRGHAKRHAACTGTTGRRRGRGCGRSPGAPGGARPVAVMFGCPAAAAAPASGFCGLVGRHAATARPAANGVAAARWGEG